MAYKMYMGMLLLPVTPAKLETRINNSNQTIKLINDGEVNILKAAGLTDIHFTALIPAQHYPFARYANGFQGAKVFLDYFEQLKKAEKSFQFIVSRCLPKGELLFDTNLSVSLEEYKIVEDVQNAFDLEVEISLKQYRAYATKTITITVPSPTAPVIQVTTRPETVTPDPPKKDTGKKYTSVKLTVGRGGSLDGGNCALSKYTAKPGEAVTVLPRARSGYAGDYFTYNGVKKTGSWTVTPSGSVATIAIKVFYKKVAVKTTTTTNTTKKPTVVVKSVSTSSSTITSGGNKFMMAMLN